MKQKSIFILLALVFFIQKGNAQEPAKYTAKSAYELINTIEPAPFTHTQHPGAQWFPLAGPGLFIHWGIHSVAALNPSWSMIKNCWWLERECPVPAEEYYRLADEFDPKAYDPEKWVLAAMQAGFQYVVLTAKHHDGYCLWPSGYGEWNTGKYMHGRDLLRPYVDACRKYGLKVGFYYSPRDWADPDYAFPYVDHDLKKEGTAPKLAPEENQKKFDRFFKTTIGQLSELMTRYGPIDLLWLDGVEWPGVNTYPDKVHVWLRTLQPSMVINPRWNTNDENKSFGDFKTEEDSWSDHLTESPVKDGEWWEFCESWSGHWGYSPLAKYRNIEQVISHLVHARSFGGNFLLNIGPAPDGTMREGYYKECIKLAIWMEKNKESVVGTQAVMNWKELAGIPMTKNGNNYYVHLLTGHPEFVTVKNLSQPTRVIFLENGKTLDSSYSKKEGLKIKVPVDNENCLDRVIKLCFD